MVEIGTLTDRQAEEASMSFLSHEPAQREVRAAAREAKPGKCLSHLVDASHARIRAIQWGPERDLF